MVEIIASVVGSLSSLLWIVFLPVLLVLGASVIVFTIRNLKALAPEETEPWPLGRVKSALSISVASKVGTGAVIGVLAAFWKGSAGGAGGEALVLWALVGMLFLVPLTYSEVLFTQVSQLMPRAFIERFLSPGAARIYVLSLSLLYAFGFVGFQFTGMQTVLGIISDEFLNRSFSSIHMLLYVIIPMVAVTALIIITKNHGLFIDVLGSLISLVILLYSLLFVIILGKTGWFIPEYFSRIWEDFTSLRTASTGLPLGFILAFQRIIQTSETALGTSALASSDRENGPRREALLQVIATLLTLFVALVITSYIFSYGRYHLPGIELSGNGIDRIRAYIDTVSMLTGPFGLGVILVFFLLSGYCTVLGSFHFINTTMRLSENLKILFYLILISLSGLMSLSHFNIIFDVADLLMFMVGSLFILALFRFSREFRRVGRIPE